MKTKGELIVACLKQMFVNDGQLLDTETISQNTEYSSYTVNIIESINRAINEIAKADRLPKKSFDLTKYDGNKGTYLTRYDLTLYASDLYKIKKVVYETEDMQIPNVSIRFDSENILVLPTITDGKYIITYSPSYSNRLTYLDIDTKEIGIPEDLIDIIPYFVKGELFQEEDTDKALLSMNQFFAFLGNQPTKTETQSKIKTVFRQ